MLRLRMTPDILALFVVGIVEFDQAVEPEHRAEERIERIEIRRRNEHGHFRVLDRLLDECHRLARATRKLHLKEIGNIARPEIHPRQIPQVKIFQDERRRTFEAETIERSRIGDRIR